MTAKNDTGNGLASTEQDAKLLFFYNIELLKIELGELNNQRYFYEQALRDSCGRTSAHMKVCLKIVLQEIEEKKKEIQEVREQ